VWGWARYRGVRGVTGGQQSARVALLVVLTLCLAACGPVSHAEPGSYFPVIRAPVATISPTPGPLTYTVGAWASNSSPLPTDQITIYVSFRNAGTPVAGGDASIQVNLPQGTQSFGPTATDASGYAAFTVYFANARPGRPVIVNATVSYEGQVYQGTTTFAAMPVSGIGIATPSP
jgi:hypothetical protein